jgi:Ni,Fe-hydrogenase III small subunit/NAD-dependent dihydropyrimidine dehydrogenase PreA subunit
MKKTPIGKAIRNLFSKVRTESAEDLFARRSKMPFPGPGCTDCGKCAASCTMKAITVSPKWTIDIGRCTLCMDCLPVCPNNVISVTDAPDYSLRREDLIFMRDGTIPIEQGTINAEKLRVMKGSVSIREVDTGSCNACEVEVNSLSNPYYDMERFGLKIVASPRHADMLLVTGPVTENMHTALLKAIAATPDPKIIVAMGSCAISGGMFTDGRTIGEGVNDTAEADMFIPGCPPSPDRLLRAFLSALGRRPAGKR